MMLARFAFVAVLAVACSGAPTPGGTTPVQQTDVVLHEIQAGIGTVDAIVAHDVDTAVPPPRNLAEIDAILHDVADANAAFGPAIGVLDAAISPEAKISAGCAVRVIGDRVIALLLRVIPFLQDLRLTIPPEMSVGLQAVGILTDALAPSCPPPGGRQVAYASVHARVVRALALRGIPLAPLPAHWMARLTRGAR
jgi:hypothetical protein